MDKLGSNLGNVVSLFLEEKCDKSLSMNTVFIIIYFSEETLFLSSAQKNCEHLTSFLDQQLSESGLTFIWENHCLRDSKKQKSEAASLWEMCDKTF